MSESVEGAAQEAVRLDTEGSAAPPRSNGELVFSAPWESRVFGLAIALRDAGVIEWEEFRQGLIAEIATWDQSNPEVRSDFVYYRHWQRALERLLDRLGLCDRDLLRARVETLAARPHGHDHG